MSLRGRGQAYDDPSALLRGEPGRPVDLSMDLTWTTAGTPYQYRLTPRYEIPCTVSGTVVADGRTIAYARPCRGSATTLGECGTGGAWIGCGAPCICSDGTHLHGVDLRIPGSPPIGVGYIQPPDGPLVELQAVSARETFGDNDLPLATDAGAEPRRCHRDRGDQGPRTGAAHRDRWPGEPVPARLGDGHHRRRSHRRRLAGVEPQPANVTACVTAAIGGYHPHYG